MSIKTPTNTPSLQHLASVLDINSPEKTAQRIIHLRDSGPTIKTFEARKYVGLVLSGEHDTSWIERQARLISDHFLRQAALEIIPLASQLKAEHGISWFRPAEPQKILFTRSVSVPINPLGYAGCSGKICVVWPQIWKTKTLTADQFNIVCSVLYHKLICQDHDLSDLLWAEMSAVASTERVLTVRTLEAARIFDQRDLAEIGKILDASMAIVASTPRKKRTTTRRPDPNQGSFGF
jgi:hypothetical protein